MPQTDYLWVGCAPANWVLSQASTTAAHKHRNLRALPTALIAKLLAPSEPLWRLGHRNALLRGRQHTAHQDAPDQQLTSISITTVHALQGLHEEFRATAIQDEAQATLDIGAIQDLKYAELVAGLVHIVPAQR